jgi:hypothetical protein
MGQGAFRLSAKGVFQIAKLDFIPYASLILEVLRPHASVSSEIFAPGLNEVGRYLARHDAT